MKLFNVQFMYILFMVDDLRPSRKLSCKVQAMYCSSSRLSQWTKQLYLRVKNIFNYYYIYCIWSDVSCKLVLLINKGSK